MRPRLVSSVCLTIFPIPPPQIDKVPREVLKRVDVFYICAVCGKVFWAGSHLDSALHRLKTNGTVQSPEQFSDAAESTSAAVA